MVAALCLLAIKRRDRAAQAAGSAPARLAGREKWRRAGWWVLANGIFGQTLGVSCYQWALKTTKAGLVLAIVSTSPLVVIPFSRVMGEGKIEPRSVVGALIAVAGAIALALARG